MGLGRSQLQVHLDGPRTKVTNREIETVSGKISGGAPARLIVYVNDTSQGVTLDQESFQSSVSLSPGLNAVRVVALDQQGVEAQDVITVKYLPVVIPNGIAITAPRDRQMLTPEDPPVIVVEGEVADTHVSTAWLVANGHRIATRVLEGRFRQPLPVFDSVLNLLAEAPSDSGVTHRSEPVTVYAASPTPSVGLLVMDWRQASVDLHAEGSVLWRANPGRLDVPIQMLPLKVFKMAPNGTPPEVFYLRNVKPGVYTFVLRYRASDSGVASSPTFYLASGRALITRNFPAVSLTGKGKVVLARILLPEGILWEQDEWFTGASESAETITKFRFPEGISWTERKADFQ